LPLSSGSLIVGRVELSQEDRRRIARRTMRFVGAIVVLGTSAAVLCALLGAERVAVGVLVGHLLAIVCGLSWIVGAVSTFDGPFTRFAAATLGPAILRGVLVIAVVFVGGVVFREHVDLVGMLVSFAATQLALHIAQADCFMKLADASKAKARA